jgi:hypothetical protein
MNKQYKSIVSEIKDLLEDACSIKVPVQEYIEFLEEVSSDVEGYLMAAQDDLARLEDEENEDDSE